MSVRCVLKKVIQVLVYDSLVMGISSISIFFILTPQRSYSQEASKIVETSSNLQQQNTLIESYNNQYATDSIPSAISQSVRKIAKKRGFKKHYHRLPAIDKMVTFISPPAMANSLPLTQLGTQNGIFNWQIILT